MADQQIALKVQRPIFDYPAALQEGQKIQRNSQLLRQGEAEGQLKAMELDDSTAQHGALKNYRAAAGAGDKNALGKLKAYPELQAKFHAAIEGMKPSEQAIAIKRSQAIGAAARSLAAYPQGSRERAAAWAKQIDGLASAGYLQPDVADQYKRAGPSDLIL